MSATLSSLTSAQLKQAAAIKDKIEALNQQLAALIGSDAKPGKPGKRRGMSAAGRARIAAAAKARWAKVHAAKAAKGKPAAKPAKKRKMSAAGRARIIAAQKARWAKIHADKKA